VATPFMYIHVNEHELHICMYINMYVCIYVYIHVNIHIHVNEQELFYSMHVRVCVIRSVCA